MGWILIGFLVFSKILITSRSEDLSLTAGSFHWLGAGWLMTLGLGSGNGMRFLKISRSMMAMTCGLFQPFDSILLRYLSVHCIIKGPGVLCCGNLIEELLHATWDGDRDKP